ncbi:hypothetical protein TRFO_15387 [Tritrichomonas foetus]|uniref:Uncharacterized protein n=1 Tax=Tritrichomonas foetus TaxID=1144522 RepID=A0A1J4KSU6_9EUKA|nr:hypothetical protein TRFO_15387 [Tritrichomonas foetus]|eukprot:OHT14331.1 hypothetical protein TRFO_15387 [Tritrichomonas foetus]
MSESEGDENVHTTIILPNADITCNNQELFDSIRIDDIEKFQDLTSQFDNLNSVVLNLQGSDVPWMLRHQPLLPFVVAYFGASECFSYLLLLDKIDFDIVDNFGRHLYQFVVAGGSLEILRALDEKGIKLNMIADKNGNNIVHYAAKFGHFDVLKWLYVHGCKCFTDRNINGATPLMWACSGGNPEMINFLLQQGAKVNEHTRFEVLKFF